MEKKQVSQDEFNKRVEIESAYLTYMDRIPKREADAEALKYVKTKFEVVEKNKQ